MEIECEEWQKSRDWQILLGCILQQEITIVMNQKVEQSMLCQNETGARGSQFLETLSLTSS